MSAPTRFYGPALLTTTPTTLFTANDRSVIELIHIMNESVSSVNLSLSIGTDAAGTRIYDSYPIPAGQMRAIPEFFVVNTGETMQGSASVNSAIVLVISGRTQPLTTGWGNIAYGSQAWGG